jgi:hypothetical protein
MRARFEFFGDNRSIPILSLLFFLAVLLGVPSYGKKNQPNAVSLPKYDLPAETKIKGTVDEVKLPPKGSEKEIAHLTVKEGSNSVDAYLCPKSFFDDMGMTFAKGDEVSMTGSKIKQGDADLFLVREIVKGTDTFALRDAKGEPVWDWRH